MNIYTQCIKYLQCEQQSNRNDSSSCQSNGNIKWQRAIKDQPKKHGIILLHSWCTVESERRWFHFSLLVAACNMKFCDKIKGIHCDFVILFLTFFCSLSLFLQSHLQRLNWTRSQTIGFCFHTFCSQSFPIFISIGCHEMVFIVPSKQIK